MAYIVAAVFITDEILNNDNGSTLVGNISEKCLVKIKKAHNDSEPFYIVCF
jgi:hypothetical protein